MYQKITNIVSNALRSNASCVATVEQALRVICNERVNSFSMAQMLAIYLDKIVRVTSHTSEDELDRRFEKVMKIFNYIEDKDVFHEYHRRLLCKRLLESKTSEENERAFVSLLKDACGQTWTNTLEGMVNDIKLNQDLSSKFKQSPQFSSLPFEFSANVLNTVYWPISKADMIQGVIVPPQMQQCVELFKTFYHRHAEAHVLTWCYGLGTIVMKCIIGNTRVDAIVSTLQV